MGVTPRVAGVSRDSSSEYLNLDPEQRVSIPGIFLVGRFSRLSCLSPKMLKTLARSCCSENNLTDFAS